ncbi:MAG: hypothetical protein AAB425_15135 [Bdellovibrionota bacterium]
MKCKTSITLDSKLLKELDREVGKNENRSSFIEHALVVYLEQRRRLKRDSRDLEILDGKHLELNREALELLDFQADT